MNEVQFITSHFKQYYEKTTITAPSIEKREFGFGNTKKIDFRHKSFTTQAELKNYLIANTPKYTSFSTAYYEFPWSTPMEKKEYHGADLIFDLDNTYPQDKHLDAPHQDFLCNYCISKVAQDTQKLVEEFLIPDFGFTQNELHINFSGSKGFHVHIRNEKVKELSHDARRAIADYITGKTLTVDSIFPRRAQAKTAPRNGPTANTNGWLRRINQTAQKYAQQKGPEKLQALQNLCSQGNWATFKQRELENILTTAIHDNAVQIDAPCTFDLHRLIRLPETLHGDSALIAKTINATQLTNFNPLNTAPAFSYSEKVKIKLNEPHAYNFIHKEHTTTKPTTDPQEAPLQIALALICKGKAQLT